MGVDIIHVILCVQRTDTTLSHTFLLFINFTSDSSSTQGPHQSCVDFIDWNIMLVTTTNILYLRYQFSTLFLQLIVIPGRRFSVYETGLLLRLRFLHIISLDWLAVGTNNKMNTPDEDESEEITQKVEDLSIKDDLQTIICANCGKEGGNINICNKCKAATYCNASCKKKHRSKHKEACERRIAELYEEQMERKKRAAELHDMELFKQPAPNEDCDICMLPLPPLHTGKKYKSCCGKVICSGCIYAVEKRDGGVGLCPFCRTPTPTPEEIVEQYKKRMEVDDAEAIRFLGGCHSKGEFGLPQDHTKALELWHQSANFGNATSYYNIGNSYYQGDGVERDENKATQYFELAAIGGFVLARHNLGWMELRALNFDRALKHFILAAGGGLNKSLKMIQKMFMDGVATKEDYTQAIRGYQAYLGEIKSVQRDEAAAFSDRYKYYEL